MKKITILVLIAITAASCQKGVRLSASVRNPNSDSLVIHNNDFKITLKGSEGNFAGNFDAPRGFYQLFDGAAFSTLYLSKGSDLKIMADGKRFAETLAFSGNGSKENTFLLIKKKEDQKLKDRFRSAVPDDSQLQDILKKRLEDAKIRLASQKYDRYFPSLMLAEYERENQEIIEQLALFKAKENSVAALKNTPAPDFNFENLNGGTSKLSSLRGSVVYVDIWATWCGPCKSEIPHLKKLEENFIGKPVQFVSISIDAPKDRAKWRKFAIANNLKGMQLLANDGWNSEWIKHFKIAGIPRFVIIGKDGQVADSNAPRPSSSESATTLNHLIKN